MLNSISCFLFGSSGEEPTTETTTGTTTTTTVPPEGAECRLKETPTEEEWILIDKSSQESSPDRRSASPSPFLHPAARSSPHTTTPLVVPVGGESSDSDNGGSSPQRMEQSPLENLLIEHPSMSVYQHRLRQNSAGIESDISESSDAGETLPPLRRAPRRQPRTVAAHAGLSSVQQTVRATEVAARRSKKRQLSVTQLARDNLTANRVVKRQRNKSRVVQPTPRSAGKRC